MLDFIKIGEDTFNHRKLYLYSVEREIIATGRPNTTSIEILVTDYLTGQILGTVDEDILFSLSILCMPLLMQDIATGGYKRNNYTDPREPDLNGVHKPVNLALGLWQRGEKYTPNRVVMVFDPADTRKSIGWIGPELLMQILME
jgi:hypothetical protein